MHQSMSDGDAVSARQYADARKQKRVAVGQLDDAWEKFDILLAPSAKGEAPAGLGSTGDAIFNRFWTLLGTPCIALPFNTGPFGLPLSVQLIGKHGSDDQLISWARWVESRLS
jgi:Asp-tRNA(Asn)/Glu-tRNA(Gln) amidotransferase A subunit family amidase